MDIHEFRLPLNGLKILRDYARQIRKLIKKRSVRGRRHMSDYEKIVLKEGGYTLELSNRGNKRMENPNPLNPKKEDVRCAFPGCEKKTKSIMGACPAHQGKITHTRDWFGRLIPPGYSREDCQDDIIPHHLLTEIMIQWMDADTKRQQRMDAFMDDVLGNIVGKIPDSTTLQNALLGKVSAMTPDQLVNLVRSLVEKHFPEKEFGKVRVDDGAFKGKELKQVPLRIAAGLVALAFACEEANRGDLWSIKQNGLPEASSRRASAYMSSVYYLMRRHTRATPKQAEVSLRH